ncbi:dienelactone hydrolase-related protein [Indibacter alkaliphilus LW1]|uniref:Dienelactone hydrolase-related protein n=1 Tax=Indibacter alkaliphilus (strain CCUG 57479 / KCTC 22604 / LW1) TaxID=1189612 RepID=S2E097_INDAL|nr:dienelactone hydrolase family protein [Indibacter alkaliphilus]EOZ95468.1 dienelactone hydrolase-related protein [Indibacter alkaliphilus LW1]
MHKIFISISLILTGMFAFWINGSERSEPNNEITICHTGPSEMIAFLDDPAFVAFHPSPVPFDFEGLGEMVSFPASDGKDASGYLIKAKEDSDQWLFVYQEWWGLNDNIKEESDRFYNDLGGKVNVLALDMYDGNVTSNPQEAGNFMRSTNEERLEAIVMAGKQYAGSDAKIANVGWCFGGAWSLKSALLLGDQNIGSIIYYGMPVREVERLKTLNSDVLGLFATEQNISKEVIEEFASAMDQAGKDLEYKIFDAVHGFANPSNPRHDEEATKEAYLMALSYLQDKFN